jgi:hypothetical protein
MDDFLDIAITLVKLVASIIFLASGLALCSLPILGAIWLIQQIF